MIRLIVALECDNCCARMTGPSEREAVIAGRNAGWSVVDGRDLCPECADGCEHTP